MRTLIVMATQTCPSGTGEELLEGYRLNADQIISIRDIGVYSIRISDDTLGTIRSPICEIRLPGLTVYASGIADEILARAR